MQLLPKPGLQGLTVERAIDQRRSARSFTQRSVPQAQLSQLLHATAGITGKAFDKPLRSVPSAGALFPVEVYVAVHAVDEVKPGLYHYRAEGHGLELVVAGDLRQELTSIGLGQRLFGEAALSVVLTAVAERTERKYRHLTSRFIAIEVGHAAQNLLLQATSLGLGAVAVGVFKENELNRLLNLNTAKEEALYLVGVGATP
ncbi:MAG: SagB/ThcOx family dehydrogenase [Pseudomonadota bacterium]